MSEAQGVMTAVMFADPKRIELFLPVDVAAGTARAASLWAAAELGLALEELCDGILLPHGVAIDIEFVDEDGDLAEIQPPEWQQRWVARANEDHTGWTLNDDILQQHPPQVWSTGLQVEADALLVLADQAHSVPVPRPGMGVRWRSIDVIWTRAAVPDEAVFYSEGDESDVIRVVVPEVRPEPYAFEVEREDDTWYVSHPHVIARYIPARLAPPISISARQEGKHGDARVVLRIDVNWSWWRVVGHAPQRRLEEAIDPLVDRGWRFEEPAADVRLGPVSVEGADAPVPQPTPPPSPPPPPARAPAPFPVGATVGGDARIDAVLFNCIQGTHASGTRANGTPVLVTTRWAPGGMPQAMATALAYRGAGLANLVMTGTIDGYPDIVAVVEDMPPGRPVSSELPARLTPIIAADLVLGITRSMRAAHAMGAVLHEVRPELVYVVRQSDGAVAFSGMAPRAAAVLLGPWAAPDQTTNYPFDDVYVAPEVVAGALPDARSDVFSLGAVLAHWLTGEHPFGGAGLMAQLAAIHAGIRRPWPETVPLRALVDRMLSADPSARPSLDDIERAFTSPAPPPVDPLADLLEAVRAGDFAGALAALGRSDEATSPAGTAIGSILLAHLGRYEEADRQAAASGDATVRGIVRGEWQRAARWLRPDSAQQIVAAMNLPYLPLYGHMALALVTRDAATADRVAAELRDRVPPIAGRVWDMAGERGGISGYSSIADADDAIGQLLECYTEHGLVYYPLEMLRIIDFPHRKTVLDVLAPPAVLQLHTGAEYSVRVPRLYATSSTSPDEFVRAGRVTNFDYVGSARRGIGQRDFVLDGGRFLGMDRVARLELYPPKPQR